MVTQREHVDTVAARAGIPVNVVALAVRTHLAVLSESMAAGEKVTLTSFGTFSTRETGTGSVVASFTAGSRLRAAVADSRQTRTAKKPAAKKPAAKKTPATKAPAKSTRGARTTASKKTAAPTKKAATTAKKRATRKGAK